MSETVVTITCPQCGHAFSEAVPADRCQWRHDCPGCGAVLEAAGGAGACCVHCTHGAPPAPARACCG